MTRRWNEAVRSKDGPALSNMLSTSQHLRYQGSAEGEEWSGPALRAGFPDHVREIPDFEWDEHSLEAFEAGPVGWAHCTATLHFGTDTKPSHTRFTFVWMLEDGVWRIVQMHVSNPTPNIEKIGVEHHVLNRLVDAAREGFRQDQREGMASVMFTDIAESSALAAELGDRNWTAAIQRHLDLVRTQIEAENGQLIKSLCDGTMSSFTSAGSALRAAISIQRSNARDAAEPKLGLRIGLHTGDVIQTDDDFFGTVVNKSARITALSAPHEIWVSDATRLIAGSPENLSFGKSSSAELKGLPGQHRVHRLDWRDPSGDR
ncbi:MAG: nuclear transport factor 2 family protein [Pseudomonadota bacterium]